MNCSVGTNCPHCRGQNIADVGLAPQRGVLLGNVSSRRTSTFRWPRFGEGDKLIAPAQLYLDNATCVWGAPSADSLSTNLRSLIA